MKLEIRNLSKLFDNTKEAVKDVSFVVNEGEFLSILGPSGCGKTTLLRMLIGLIQPTSGTILKDGVDITNLDSSKRGMGFVFQNYALFENMTVIQNVEYALKIKLKRESKEDIKKAKADLEKGLIDQKEYEFRVNKAHLKHKESAVRARKYSEELIDTMGLREHMFKKPSTLSGGQQQRVAIARTLALRPDIILFDEPMSALDVATRLALRKELKDLQKLLNTTMIYITHDQEEAFAMSDKILVMDTAVAVQLGTPEEIIEHPANKYVEDFVVGNLRTKIKSLKKYVHLAK